MPASPTRNMAHPCRPRQPKKDALPTGPSQRYDQRVEVEPVLGFVLLCLCTSGRSYLPGADVNEYPLLKKNRELLHWNPCPSMSHLFIAMEADFRQLRTGAPPGKGALVHDLVVLAHTIMARRHKKHQAILFPFLS